MTTIPATCPSCHVPLVITALVWRYGVPHCPRCGTGIQAVKENG
jgi:hypothetical protein